MVKARFAVKSAALQFYGLFNWTSEVPFFAFGAFSFAKASENITDGQQGLGLNKRLKYRNPISLNERWGF
jgi:hypothetical protein